MEVRDIVQEAGIKTIPIEKKCKKAKWLSGEALQIAVKRREAKSKGRDAVVAQVQPQSIHQGMDVAMSQQNSIFKNRPSARP